MNYWQPNTYFSDERITSINSNLYNGLEWVTGNYVKHGDKIQFRLHFSFGATRSESQIEEAKELGIIYIHTETLPTSDELWALIASLIEENPHLKFYKINCVGNTHLQNDRTSSMMVLLTPTNDSCNIVYLRNFRLRIRINKLKSCMLRLNYSFMVRLLASIQKGDCHD